jgi:hypothetical protein
MQAYSSTLLQFIFKFQLVYFPYFYDDKVQKNAPIWCIVETKWCIVISQDILEIEKYQPKTRDICRFQAIFAFICPNLIIGVVEPASSSLIARVFLFCCANPHGIIYCDYCSLP